MIGWSWDEHDTDVLSCDFFSLSRREQWRLKEKKQQKGEKNEVRKDYSTKMVEKGRSENKKDKMSLWDWRENDWAKWPTLQHKYELNITAVHFGSLWRMYLRHNAANLHHFKGRKGKGRQK